jgi:hypothetical protein
MNTNAIGTEKITDSAQELADYNTAIMVDGELVTVDARTLTRAQLQAQLAACVERDSADFYRHLLGMEPTRVSLGECISVDAALEELVAEDYDREAANAILTLIVDELDSDRWYDSEAGVQYMSQADLDVVREQLDTATTYTATVTTNPTDVTLLSVEVTDKSGKWMTGFDFTTRAYQNPAGDFDADSFDANTCAEEIAGELAQIGWRPVDGISFDAEHVAFAAESMTAEGK